MSIGGVCTSGSDGAVMHSVILLVGGNSGRLGLVGGGLMVYTSLYIGLSLDGTIGGGLALLTWSLSKVGKHRANSLANSSCKTHISAIISTRALFKLCWRLLKLFLSMFYREGSKW